MKEIKLNPESPEPAKRQPSSTTEPTRSKEHSMSNLITDEILKAAQAEANEVDHEDHDEAVRVALEVAAPLIAAQALQDGRCHLTWLQLSENLAKAWDEGVEAYETRRARDESLPLTNPYRLETRGILGQN